MLSTNHYNHVVTEFMDDIIVCMLPACESSSSKIKYMCWQRLSVSYIRVCLLKGVLASNLIKSILCYKCKLIDCISFWIKLFFWLLDTSSSMNICIEMYGSIQCLFLSNRISQISQHLKMCFNDELMCPNWYPLK